MKGLERGGLAEFNFDNPRGARPYSDLYVGTQRGYAFDVDFELPFCCLFLKEFGE